MIYSKITYSIYCDICHDHEDKEVDDFNFNKLDFINEMKNRYWLIDDNKTICPKCKVKLERIKML